MEQPYYRLEELVGKDVYDAKARKVGTVTDVGYSKDGKNALIIGIERFETTSNPITDRELVLSSLLKGRFETILFERVSEIGDIIILRPDTETQTKACPICNRQHEKQAKFCVKCGHKF